MCLRNSWTTSRALSVEYRVNTCSLMSAAGDWSLMPMQAVRSSVKLPSGVVSPMSMPNSSQKLFLTRS